MVPFPSGVPRFPPGVDGNVPVSLKCAVFLPQVWSGVVPVTLRCAVFPPRCGREWCQFPSGVPCFPTGVVGSGASFLQACRVFPQVWSGVRPVVGAYVSAHLQRLGMNSTGSPFQPITFQLHDNGAGKQGQEQVSRNRGW